MKNLTIGIGQSGVLPSLTPFAASRIIASDDKLYVASNGLIQCLSSNLKVEWTVEISPPSYDASEPVNSGEDVTGMTMLTDQDSICISLHSGPLLLINLALESPELEEVGFVEDGITEMEWGPDAEILVLITGKGNLIVMSQDWEVLRETPLAPQDELPSANQFRDAKISWRGDGKFFATSHLSHDGLRREVQVWDRATLELHTSAQQLHSKAPNLPPLDPVLSWQPNRRHLYTSQRSSNDPLSISKVLLFERNGLPHGSFDLVNTNGSSVRSMKWSHDSELLAILLGPSIPLQNVPWSLQIWHRSNWHWYLKLERSYPPSPCPPVFTWDQEQSLHVISTPHYEKLGALTWGYCVSRHGTAVVVDGGELLITPLRSSKVPPPMAAVKALLPSPAVAVAISSAQVTFVDDKEREEEGWEERLVAVLSNGSLALLRSVQDDFWEETLDEQEGEGDGKRGLEPWILPLVLADDCLGLIVIREICWLDNSSLLVLVQRGGGEGTVGSDALVEIVIEGEWGSLEATLRCGAPIALPHTAGAGSIAGIASTPGGGGGGGGEGQGGQRGGGGGGGGGGQGGGAIVQGASGQLYVFQQSRNGEPGKLLPLPPSSSFPQRCSQMMCLPHLTSSLKSPNLSPPAMGLHTPSGNLYWGSSLVAGEVTSFTIRQGGAGGPALLYTTRRSLLYTVFFSQLLSGSYHHRELTAAAEKLHQGPSESIPHDDGESESSKPHRSVPHQSQHKLGSSGITVIQRPSGNDDDMRAAMHAAMRPSEWSAAARDVVVRAVEQGSLLISAPEDEVEVLLQMPRGNLETIAPRALVLAATTRALASMDFARAWSLATTQRLDLNLIVDFGWPRAVLPPSPSPLPSPSGIDDQSKAVSGASWMDLFVKHVPRASDLCDLLFSLRPENVLSSGGVYANALQLIEDEDKVLGSPVGGPLDVEDGRGKVDLVCDALRAAVEALPGGREHYITVIVTCYARKVAKQLDLALSCIKEAKEAALSSPTLSSSTSSLGNQTGAAEKALKHLLLHVDPDELYRVALGMYDLSLAYMVIAHSPQKDPGEYLVELQRFAAVQNIPLRRHLINVHLRRWPLAVKDLFEAGPDYFEQALKMATEHGLLRLLLTLCGPTNTGTIPLGDTRRQRVLEAYGSQLELEQKYEDAGVAYLAAEKPEKALTAYRSAGQWRMVFVLARRLGTSAPDLRRMAVQVSDELVSSGQPKEGALVLLHHMGDVDNAVSLFAEAREWREALHTAHSREREDLVETVVAPRAAASASSLLADARESRERIGKYWARLKEVREKRLAMEAALAADGEEEDEREQDAMTDMNSSIVSGLSIYTENTHTGDTLFSGSGSSSGRPASTLGGRKAGGPKGQGKKGKAKGGKIRQGSPQEEASLAEHLSKLSPSASQLEEGGQLCELLVLLGHLDDAQTLQVELSKWASEHSVVVADLGKHPLPPHLIESQRQQQLKVARSKGGKQEGGGPQWKWSVLRE